MKKPVDYIQDLKEKRGSYYRIAKDVGVTIQAVMSIRDGNSIPKDKLCLSIARVLEIDEKEVLLSAAVARSGENEELRKIWENISKLSGIAASFIFTYQLDTLFEVLNNVYYVK